MPEHASVAWRGWHALQFDRQYGAFGGQGQIPFTAIDRYAVRYRIDGTAFEVFHALIIAMDNEYLDHEGRKAEAAKQAETPNRDN